MGRVRNGSYAEYTCALSNNVFVLNSSMNWADLAAIPESYATAWACLHQNMRISKGDTIFIRGGISALGLAAINIASNIEGVTVFSSTRNIENQKLLTENGCDSIFIENEKLGEEVRALCTDGVDSVLDIIGNTTVLDSLKMVKKGGYVCLAGFLGGGESLQFNPPANLPPAVNLNFFGSFMFGSQHFPISDIPMQAIIDNVASAAYRASPAKIFSFDNIADAHLLMESNKAGGKIVVEL